jgi:hypothetical protein
LIEQAIRKEYINESDLDSLQAWRANPSIWNQ